MNAAVVQRPMFGLFGWPRNYLILGMPMLDSLRPEQALAAVAHEYGHLAGSHGRFASFIYRLRNTWSGVETAAQKWSGAGAWLFAKAVSRYAAYFNAYTFVLARLNEYQADSASARLIGTATVADALKQFELHDAAYRSLLRTTFDSVKLNPAPPPDLALQWAQRPDRLTNLFKVWDAELARLRRKETDRPSTPETVTRGVSTLDVSALAERMTASLALEIAVSTQRSPWRLLGRLTIPPRKRPFGVWWHLPKRD